MPSPFSGRRCSQGPRASGSGRGSKGHRKGRRELRAAGAFFGPGFVGRRGASGTRSVGIPAAEGVGLRSFIEHGAPSIVRPLKKKLLFGSETFGVFLLLSHEDLRIGVGKVFAAGAPLHFGFEFPVVP